MPTYEYKCDECGYHFDYFQSMSTEPLKDCPQCGGRVQRLISSGNGFLFKGSGFYITDNRSDKYKKDKEKSEKSPDLSASKTNESKKADANNLAEKV